MEPQRREEKVNYIFSRTTKLFTHPSFYRRSEHRNITAPMPNQEKYDQAKAEVVRKRDTQGDLGFMRATYEEPLLTREQEWHVFRLYNFYKFLSLKKLQNAYRVDEAYKLIRKSDEVRNQLLLCNARLAANFAKTYPHDEIEIGFAESCDVLMRAIEYFDYNRTNSSGGTNKFSTYATWVLKKNRYQTYAYEQRDRQRFIQGVMLDDFHGRDLGYYEEVRHEERIRQVGQILTLPGEREADILRKRFGIGEEEPNTLETIGKGIGVTKERVRQLQARGINQILEKLKWPA